MGVLTKKFFERNTVLVAKELLGKSLVCGKCSGRIVETEAYLGKNDLASHASAKSRKRSQVMFGPASHAYVYFTYGNHWLFNIVTEKTGIAGAVLIRALEPLTGISLMKKHRATDNLLNLCSGPAKLCQALSIDNKLHGKPLSKQTVCVLDSKEKPQIVSTSRVGISKGKEHNYRFFVKDNPFVSRK